MSAGKTYIKPIHRDALLEFIATSLKSHRQNTAGQKTTTKRPVAVSQLRPDLEHILLSDNTAHGFASLLDGAIYIAVKNCSLEHLNPRA